MEMNFKVQNDSHLLIEWSDAGEVNPGKAYQAQFGTDYTESLYGKEKEHTALTAALSKGSTWQYKTIRKGADGKLYKTLSVFISSAEQGTESLLELIASHEALGDAVAVTVEQGTKPVSDMALGEDVFCSQNQDNSYSMLQHWGQYVLKRKLDKIHNGASEDVKERLSAVIESLGSSSSDLADIAVALGKQMKKSSAGAKEISEEISTLAATTEELTTTSGEINNNLENSTAQTEAAASLASDAMRMVESLREGNEAVSEVVKSINAIAAQTNLLALNASIEAARAGEAGRGFSVVAQEVKQLASNTGKATEEIFEKVEKLQELTSRVVDIISQCNGAISNLEKSSKQIKTTVSQQFEATQEMAGVITASSNRCNDFAGIIKKASGRTIELEETIEGLTIFAAEIIDCVSEL